MTPKYKTVIFDKDGTLLDSAEGIVNAIRYTAKKLGVSFPPGFDERRLIGPPLKLSYRDGLGIVPEMLDRAVELHREYYVSKGLYEAQLYPGIKDLLRDLNGAGVKVCVATAKHYIPAGIMMEHFGLTPFIHHSEMNNGTERKSSKKEMIASVLAHCDSEAKESVMIGDTVYDVEGAVGNDVSFIGVLYGYGLRKEMEEAGARTFAANTREMRAELLGE